MKHFATGSFWRCYEALPPETRALAEKNFDLLKRNPSHPSLHFKRIRDDLWSARVGIHHRALALKLDESFGWFWIDGHADYDQLVG